MRIQNLRIEKTIVLTAALILVTVASATRTTQAGVAEERTATDTARISRNHTRASQPVTLSMTAANTIAPAAVDELTREQIEDAIEEYFASIGSLNIQRFVDNFAPDGVLEDPVGTPPLQGHQAIAAYFGAIIAPFSHIKPTVQEIIVRGREAAVNWRLRLKTATGKNIVIDGMGVFKFNQDGKLQSVREFFDLEAFLEDLQN